jgi:zinc protease
MSDIIKVAAILAIMLLGARALPGAETGKDGAAPAAGKVFPYPVQHTVLSNGLKVIAVPVDSPGIIAYWTVVRAGSRNEVEPGRSGFAHFFEHMMFRGTETYSRERYNDVLKALGADHNAFTTDDFTAYHMVAPADALDTLMTIESDRFMHLKYPVDDFRKEAGAVLGEYNKNAANPLRRMQEALRDAAYQKHTYKHTTIGFLKDIEDMPNQYQYSLAFFDRFYRPENCVVLVTGDVRPDEVFRAAKKHYGAWKRGSYAAQVPVEPAQKEEKHVDLDWPVATQPYLFAGYHAPAFSTTAPDLAALDLLSQMLFSDAAPLYQTLVVEDQVVDMLHGGAEDHRDPYLFTWVARIKKEEDVSRVEREITTALEALKEDLVPADRLREVKSHMKYAFAMRLDTAAGTAEALARMVALTGDPADIDRLYALYDRITPEQIRDAARRTFVPANRTLVDLRHRAASPAAGAAAGADSGDGGGSKPPGGGR